MTGDLGERAVAAQGFVAPEFEGVREALERVADAYGEAGCALSAYVDGSPVVDLWWGQANGGPWQKDTLVTIMSSTKGALTLCAQLLFERGLLDPDAKVTTYWPEYGANGKQETLV